MKPWLSKLRPSLLKLTRTDETWTYCSEKHFLKLDDDDFFSQTTFLHFFVRFEFPGKSRYRLAGRREAAATLTLRRGVDIDADQEMIFRVQFYFFPDIFSESRPADVLAAQQIMLPLSNCLWLKLYPTKKLGTKLRTSILNQDLSRSCLAPMLGPPELERCRCLRRIWRHRRQRR